MVIYDVGFSAVFKLFGKKLFTWLPMRAFMVQPMVPMVYQYRSRFYQLYHW